MSAKDKIVQIQQILGVNPDGIFGPKSQQALDNLITESKPPAPQNAGSSISTAIQGKASSFADPADVAAFKRCKAQGRTDQDCFSVGDNGIGCWGDDVTRTDIPYVAIPPDYMILKWGSVDNAKHKPINVTYNGQTSTCIVGDRMPWLKNIKNDAILDMAPGAQKLFNLKPPFMVNVSWSKA